MGTSVDGEDDRRDSDLTALTAAAAETRHGTVDESSSDGGGGGGGRATAARMDDGRAGSAGSRSGSDGGGDDEEDDDDDESASASGASAGGAARARRTSSADAAAAKRSPSQIGFTIAVDGDGVEEHESPLRAHDPRPTTTKFRPRASSAAVFHMAFEDELRFMRDVVFFTAILGLLALQILLTIKLDNVAPVTWTAVAIPLLAAAAIIMAVLIAETVVTLRRKRFSLVAKRVARLLASILTVFLFAVFILFLHHKLQGSANGDGASRQQSWIFVALPLYVIQLVGLVRDARWFVRIAQKKRRLGKPFFSSSRMKRFFGAALQIPLLAQTILLPMFLDDLLPEQVTLWMVFAPSWVFFLLLILAVCFSAGSTGLADICFSAIILLVVVIPVFLHFFLVAETLENEASISFAIVSLPMFISYGLLLLGRAFFICCCLQASPDEAYQNDSLNRFG